MLMLLPDEVKEVGDGGIADLSGSLLRGLREMCRGSLERGELWVSVLGAGLGKMAWCSAQEAGKRLDEHLVRGQHVQKQEAVRGDSDDPGRWESDNVMDLLKCVHRQRLVDVVWMLPESPCVALDPKSIEGCKMYRALRLPPRLPLQAECTSLPDLRALSQKKHTRRVVSWCVQCLPCSV